MSVPFQLVGECEPFPLESGASGVSTIFSNVVEPTLVGSASSDGAVSIVDLESGLIRTRWRPHSSAITDASFLPCDPCLVLSSSRDGLVGISDTRLPSDLCRVAKVRLSLDNDGTADVWAVDAGGSSENMLACSIDATIRAYDIRIISELDTHRHRTRSSGLLWTFKDSHTDIITCLRFHPTCRSLLISGADDDQVVFHDTRRIQEYPKTLYSSRCATTDDSDTDDDDPTVVGGFCNESPPRFIRFIGPDADVLCTVSTTEVVQAWSCPNLGTLDAEEFPIAPVIRESTRVREALRRGDSCGYIVDVTYDPISQRLFYLGGSAEGDLALFHANADSSDLVAEFTSETGHSSVVRASQVIDNAVHGPIIVTGGEEGRLCAWKQLLTS